MKSRYLIAVGIVVLTVAGMTLAQPKIGFPALPKSDRATPPAMIPPTDLPQTPPQRSYLPQPIPSSSPAPSPVDPLVAAPQRPTDKPESMTIDQLIDAIEKFEEQKTELEKKQRAFIKVLHLKAHLQKARIDSLGGAKTPVVRSPQEIPWTLGPTGLNIPSPGLPPSEVAPGGGVPMSPPPGP